MDPVKSKAANTKRTNQNNKPTVVLMTRWHAIYRCKSRLSKDIGAFKAAKIQEKLTNHTIKVAKLIQKEGLADIKVAIDGIGIKAAKKWALLNGIKTVDIQGPGNLGTKMKRQFLETHSRKNLSHQIRNPILLIGTDLPSISHFELIQALQILKHKDMVLGPSSDGGYWLIGLSNKVLNPLCTWPFSGICWGTDKVLQKTIRLAYLNQINYQLLQNKNDLDNVMDLSPWLDYKSFRLSVSSYQL
ncbi:TIGR04282 family arsenosugar biosynthesis glycosyltransferase [Prochlorococcus marinus]|uniref:TIGR04282 family arsenosugar biosynthesis glycosyltransferase n=1 Tax=Prochlorococcus marinus TaxID=1219 RepID=UPI0022B48BF0|nr:TIGR04282 family arsenosugar biosynthesis glycosyltransferase [Prochlorococcus marinus]